MLTSLDMLQLLLASAVIAWASHVLWKKWRKSKESCEGDCVTCPSKLAGLCEDGSSMQTNEKSEDEPELTQLPSRQEKKAQEDHV